MLLGILQKCDLNQVLAPQLVGNMVLVYLLKRWNQELYPPGSVQDDCICQRTQLLLWVLSCDKERD